MIRPKEPCETAIRALSARPCQADVEELFDFMGMSYENALRLSIRQSVFSRVAWLGDDPIFAFGVTVPRTLTGVHHPWMLRSSKVEKLEPRVFKRVKAGFNIIRRKYPRLENYVSVKNRGALALIYRLGFTVDEPAPAGAWRRSFRRFYMEP